MAHGPGRPEARPVGLLESALVVATPLVVGALGTIWTAPAIGGWYRTLEKPPWNPPDWIFGPVWTALYALMGIALLQVWRLDRNRPEVRLALALFGVQLLLNLGWSWVFFERRRTDLALLEILALLLAIGATVASFGRLRRGAALLLLPYLAWTAFATLLNADIVRRNG
jgi:benzodiazapine receptor